MMSSSIREKRLAIRIEPIKRLLYELREGAIKYNASAILCSSYPIASEKFSQLASMVILQFEDTVNEESERRFTAEMATTIKNFIEGLKVGTELYICCDSGESRSTAIAAAVQRYIGQDEMVIWKNPRYHPNTLVYKLQCEAFGIDVPETELRNKKQISDNALSEAIRNSRS